MDLLSFTGLQLFCGGLMLLVLAFARNEFAQWHWSWRGAAAMAYLMLLSSCVAYAAYSWLARHATPAQTGSYGLVNPAVATFLGWLILDERLSQPQLLGMVVILAGVVLVNWPESQPRI
jgi:probable blue pigment (indigoidine) exporter